MAFERRMRSNFWLLTVIAKAVLMTVAGWLAPILVAFSLGVVERRGVGYAVGFTVVSATGLAAWWVFRKLQTQVTKPEAWAVTKAFAVSTPLALAVAIPLAQIPGGYAETFLGKWFILPVVFVAIAVTATLMTFAVSLAALRMAHWS